MNFLVRKSSCTTVQKIVVLFCSGAYGPSKYSSLWTFFFSPHNRATFFLIMSHVKYKKSSMCIWDLRAWRSGSLTPVVVGCFFFSQRLRKIAEILVTVKFPSFRSSPVCEFLIHLSDHLPFEFSVMSMKRIARMLSDFISHFGFCPWRCSLTNYFFK